jgi:BON domain
MTRFPRISGAALSAALAAAAAPALAADVVELSTATTTPGYYAPGYYAPAQPAYSTAPATTYYYEVPSTDAYYAAPVTDHSVIVGDTYYDESPIIVTAPRASDDVLITDDVVDRIATDRRVSGNIGVDTFRGQVTLTGRTGGTVQKDFADQDAKSVDGVNEVENYIRPRVGEM